MTSDFAGPVVGGQKVCLSWADKLSFAEQTFWNTNNGTNIEFNKEGNPTEESIQKVLEEIGGGSIEGAYIKTSIEETQLTKKFLESKLNESNPQSEKYNPDRKKYNTLTNNCSSFVCEAVKKGGVYVPPHVIDIPVSVSTYFRILYKNVNYDPK